MSRSAIRSITFCLFMALLPAILVAADPCDPQEFKTGDTGVVFVVAGVNVAANVTFWKPDKRVIFKKYNAFAMGPMGMVACTTTKKNCDNKSVSFFAFSEDFPMYTTLITIGPNKVNPKTVTDETGAQVEMTEIGAADVDRYWDAVYSGYTKASGATTTKNCHGHAFGAGDWPEASIYGATLLLAVDTCYVGASTKEATLAFSTGHSIKVTGKQCTVNLGSGMTTPIQILDSSSEKNTYGGVYTQSKGCDIGISINKAACNQGTTFSLYKPKT